MEAFLKTHSASQGGEQTSRMRQQKDIFYDFGALSEDAFLEKEFEWAQKRNVKERVAHGFLKTYKPVIDDEPYRIFDRLSDYKAWCDKILPSWLGYGRTP